MGYVKDKDYLKGVYYNIGHFAVNPGNVRTVNVAEPVAEGEEENAPIMVEELGFTCNLLDFVNYEARVEDPAKGRLGTQGVPVQGCSFNAEEIGKLKVLIYGALARTEFVEDAVVK